MPDRDFVTGILSIVRQIIGDLTVELYLALLDELEDQGRRELFRNGTQPKLRVRSVWYVPSSY